MIEAIIASALIALFFTMGMPFAKKDWTYGGMTHDAKSTRETGWLIFLVIFVGLLVMWGSGGY